MNQIDIIPEIKRLCMEGEYDSAIALTDEIKDKKIAIKAHLLCIEHEHRRWLNKLGKNDEQKKREFQ